MKAAHKSDQVGSLVRIVTNWKPLEYETVPREEVPSGYQPVHMVSIGQVYADPANLPLDRNAPFLHPEFPEPVRKIFRRFKTVFDGLYKKTLEEWEAGFRRDVTPWREIAKWQRLVDGYDKFTAHIQGHGASAQLKRRDVASVIFQLLCAPPPTGKRVTYNSVGTLTASRVREIAKWYFSTDDERLEAHRLRVRQLFDLIQPDGPVGPSHVSLHALLDTKGTGFNLDAEFDVETLLLAADVIFGVSLSSGRHFLVYGRRILESQNSAQHRTAGRLLTIEVDTDAATDDLERLVALVRFVKGTDDYAGPGEEG